MTVNGPKSGTIQAVGYIRVESPTEQQPTESQRYLGYLLTRCIFKVIYVIVQKVLS